MILTIVDELNALTERYLKLSNRAIFRPDGPAVAQVYEKVAGELSSVVDLIRAQQRVVEHQARPTVIVGDPRPAVAIPVRSPGLATWVASAKSKYHRLSHRDADTAVCGAILRRSALIFEEKRTGTPPLQFPACPSCRIVDRLIREGSVVVAGHNRRSARALEKAGLVKVTLIPIKMSRPRADGRPRMVYHHKVELANG